MRKTKTSKTKPSCMKHLIVGLFVSVCTLAVDVSAEVTDKVDCNECGGCGSSGDCTCGDVNGMQGSVHFTLRIGPANFEQPAGGVILEEAVPVADMASPASFAWLGSSSKPGLEVIEDPNATGVIRQALTPAVLLDLVEDVSATHGATDIALYHRPDPLPAKVDGVYPVTGLTPYRTARVEALAVNGSSEVTKILAMWDPDGNPNTVDQRRWVWNWLDATSGGPGWEMGVGVDATGDLSSGDTIESLVEADLGNDQRSETRTFEAASGTAGAVKKVVETFEMFDWGEELIERVNDPAGAALTTTYAYYDDEVNDGDNFRMRRSMTDENGYWEHYSYDSIGRVTQTIAQLGDNEYLPANLTTLRAANLVTDVLYYEDDLADADSADERITRWTVKDSGTVVGVRYEVEWSQSHPGGTDDPTLYEVWEIESTSTDPEASYTGTTDFLDTLLGSVSHLGHRVTKTQRYEAGQAKEYEVAWMAYPDGTVADYAYPSGGVTVVERGYLNSGGTALEHGTRTTRTVDVSGNDISTLVEMIDPAVNSGGWFMVSLIKTTDEDAFGRPLETSHYFGAEAAAEWASAGMGLAAYTTLQTYGCCGVATRTDRYGLTTSYTYDDLGRTSSMTRPDGVTLHYTYDAAGRTQQVEREGAGESPTVDGESNYDLAGRVTSREDAGSKFTFYTYRKVKPDGSTYDPATDSPPFYQEARVYPHDASSGPVVVTWTDSHGRTVLSLTGSVSGSWSEASPPTVDVSLTAIHSRTETQYDWAGRMSESRSYHNFGSLAVSELRKLATPGNAAEGIHYYVQSGGTYDVQGRMVLGEDVLGNVTATVYDDDGRPIQTWVGTDATGATAQDPSGGGAAGNNMVQIGGSIYDSYGEMDQSLRLKPNLTTLGTFDVSGGDALATDYEEKYVTSGGAATSRVSWSKPADGVSPWTQQVYDVQGRMVKSVTYPNASTSYVLTKTTQVYDDSSAGKGRLVASRVHEADGNGGTSGNYLETTYAYDGAGRQFKTSTPGSGHQLTLYDTVGRVERSLVVADDNGTATHTDDVVATETVYGYDAADNVVWTEIHSRRHDTASTALGLLSDNPSWAEVHYAATWFDNAHRPTHVVDYGNTTP